MPLSNFYMVIVLLSAITSLVVFFQKSKAPLYLRFFPFFLFTTFAVETAGTIIAHKSGNNTALYNVFNVIEFVFYFWMFSQIIHNITIKKVLRGLLGLYPLAFLINKSFIQTGEQFHTYTSGLGSVLIALCAVYYFYELFKYPKPLDLLREPTFWITSGLLFFHCCGFPLFAYATYIYNPSSIIVHYLVSLFLITNILLYLSFTIAFLCSVRFKKSSLSVKQGLPEFVLVALWYQNIYCSFKKYWQRRFVKRKLAKLRIFARLFII